MSVVAVIAAIVLGAAFVVAGGSKLAAGRAWPAQAAGMGVPAWLAAPVPWVGLTIGALLVVQIARPWPAVAALVLLVAFTALLAQRLAVGQHPPCACFGAWSTKPLGWTHLARNAALMTLAAAAIWV
jgi:uncharacterized membrane protein YphA (DoxX/SURF4 family)